MEWWSITKFYALLFPWKLFPFRSSGPWKICKTVYRDQGFRGFFHGLVPTFAREVPGYFCFFGAYELCQYLFVRFGAGTNRLKSDLNLLETGICGAAAGTALWVIIFPFDLVKSRIQINSGSGSTSESLPRMLVTIAKSEGNCCPGVTTWLSSYCQRPRSALQWAGAHCREDDPRDCSIVHRRGIHQEIHELHVVPVIVCDA